MFLLFSGYLVNRLYDSAKKILFFVENADLEKYVNFLSKTRVFREISSELVCWKLGFKRLRGAKDPVEMAQRVSSSFDFFTRIFSKTDLLKDFPTKQNQLKNLSKFRKKPIESIKEMKQFDLSDQKQNSHAVFVTFNDLSQTRPQKGPPKDAISRQKNENNPEQTTNNEKESLLKTSNIPSLFHLTFSEIPEPPTQVKTEVGFVKANGAFRECRESKVNGE